MSDKKENWIYVSLITYHLSLSEEDFGDAVNLFVERLDFPNGIVERHGDDFAPAERDHLAPLLFENQLEGPDAETRGEHAIKSRRRAAALDVAEVRVARVNAGLVFDLAREVEAYAAEPA